MTHDQDHAADHSANYPANFPEERDWLDLPPPPISPGFTDATLAALRAQRARLAAGEDLDAEPALPRALTAAHTAPAPSPDFLAATFAAVRADRSARLRTLLKRYVAPQPTPDFVTRTLRALHDVVPVRRAPHRVFRLAVLAAAAAALLWLLPWSRPHAGNLHEAMLATHQGSAAAFSPAPFAALAAAAERDDDGALPNLAVDGLMLLAASTEER